MAKATGKHRRDNFYRIAKAEGYRSRAAIKLLQLDTCWSFLSTARAVLDLGAAPGGWLQVAVRGATPGAFVVGVDLARIRPIRGAISLIEDITTTASCSAAVRRLMDSKGVTAFDVVLHDGVGQKKRRKRDGARAQEASSQSALLIDAVRLATMFLAPKGSFITKFTKIQDFNAIRFCLQQLFEKVRVAKPMASRSTSAELYFICLEYKAPTKVQPELFDLNHLFTASLEKNKPTDEVRNPMETRPRGRTKYTGPIWKAGSASDFIWSEAQTPQEILGSFMGVSFDDPASLPIKNHELTTAEIRNFCLDLDLLDKKTLNYVWEWRTRIRHALSSCSQVIPKPDVTAVDAKVDSAELDMKDSIGDGGKEETQTHEEMVSDEEHHRYEGLLDEAHECFVIKDHKVKQQLKRVNPINPYANGDLVEKPKKRVRVRNYKEKALVLVDPLMKDKNTSGSEKKVGKEDAKRRRGKRAPQQARKRCKLAGADAYHLDMTPVLSS